MTFAEGKVMVFKPPFHTDSLTHLEVVPVKWMDRPSAKEMEIGHAFEMDRQTKGHKN